METELRQLHIVKQDGMIVVIDPETGEVMGRGVWQTAGAKPQPAKKSEPKFYPNKYAGDCHLCGQRVAVMTGQWEYKVGVKHIKCPEKEEAPRHNRFRATRPWNEPPEYD